MIVRATPDVMDIYMKLFNHVEPLGVDESWGIYAEGNEVAIINNTLIRGRPRGSELNAIEYMRKPIVQFEDEEIIRLRNSAGFFLLVSTPTCSICPLAIAILHNVASMSKVKLVVLDYEDELVKPIRGNVLATPYIMYSPSIAPPQSLQEWGMGMPSPQAFLNTVMKQVLSNNLTQ